MHYAGLLRAALTTWLMLVAMAGAAVAGPYEDAVAALGRRDYATAYQLLLPLADQGDVHAQNNLGSLYLEGNGVVQNHAEAVKWFRRAADQGFEVAQANLGSLYLNGRGVPQNYSEALKWYRLAADRGFVPAQVGLGTMYAKGEGVPQDYVQAHMWFNLAASQGTFKDAVKARDHIAAKMTPAQIAEAQKLARKWQPKP